MNLMSPIDGLVQLVFPLFSDTFYGLVPRWVHEIHSKEIQKRYIKHDHVSFLPCI